MAGSVIAPMLWVLGSPCATAALVGGVRPVRELVWRHYATFIGSGWLAVAMVLYAGFAGHGRSLLAAAPLTGLAIWIRQGGHGGSQTPEPPPAGPARERRAPRPERLAAPRRSSYERRFRRRPATAPARERSTV